MSEELQIFLELMNNHCVIHVIHQDILDQRLELINVEYFH